MRPNVLLLVWDACRLDAAREHAPTLASLAEENLWFENAITPVGQSLGAHVSLFSGEYPHEHATFTQTDAVEATLPLVADLADEGYRTVGASGNGFASPKYGFDRGFDAFHNTQGLMVYPEGLDVHGYAREVSDGADDFSTDDVDATQLLRRALGHDHPLKSLANVAAAGLSEVGGRYDVLGKLPHPRFDRYNEFCFDPADNTRLLAEAFEDAADADEPLFAFANYMDPHHPYAPPEEYQREYCGRTFSYRELSDLADRTLPWHYLDAEYSGGGFDAETLETVRNLYYGEVRSVDDHLRQLLEHLERTGQREDTIVVVVADHGENLGETNRMGERHVGHVRSASDHHLRVPAVVAHPELEGREVSEYVSLKDLYGLLTDGRDDLLESGGRELDPMLPDDGVVTGAVPRTTTSIAERYPALADLLERHLVAAYADDWKVVASSAGEEFAWDDDGERDVADAPDAVVDRARAALEGLLDAAGEDEQLDEADRAHLEALGYL